MQKCLTYINSWVANNTRGQIREFLKPDDVTMETKMVLVNALQFNGKWETPFAPSQTKTGSFMLGDGSVAQVGYIGTFFKLTTFLS